MQEEAHGQLMGEFRELVRRGIRDVVLDLSFWSWGFREEWRGVVKDVLEEMKVGGIEDGGGDADDEGKGKGPRIIIVYFDAEEEVLWRRIQERKRGVKDADSAAEISRELLASYVKGFGQVLWVD